MSTPDDLFAALGDSFQLAEDDGDLSVGSFGANDVNFDFSSELMFADDPPTTQELHQPQQQGDNNKNNHHQPGDVTPPNYSGGGSSTHDNSSNHGSSNSLSGGGMAAALAAPPSMTMPSMRSNPFRGSGGMTTSSAALQNAAVTIQGTTQFSFAAQNQQQQPGIMSNQSSSNNSTFMQQPQQQQFRQNALTNNFMTGGSGNAMNRSASIDNAMLSISNSMNQSASMNNAMMSINSQNNNSNNNNMRNASFNSTMPPPSQNAMSTTSLSSSNMFSSSSSASNQPNRFFGQQQQQQQGQPNASNWNKNELEKPKRPLSAYEFFCQERKRLGALSDAQLQVIWQDQLDGHSKAVYLQQARADRQRYITELKLWKARSERNQPVGAVGNFLKARLQGNNSSSDMLLVEANKRGRLQPAIVSCPNLNVSPSLRLQAMQNQQGQYGGSGGQANATFDNFSAAMNRQQANQGGGGGGGRPMSRFVANQMQRLQQGQGLADLASELGHEGTTAFVSAMFPRSQSASVVQNSSSTLRYKNPSTPDMRQQQQQDNLMDPLMEFPGF